MRYKVSIIVALAALSGFAIACATNSMPPVGVVDVSPSDLADAESEGYRNPARAAGLKNLDQKAKALIGESNWKRDAYHGHVTYRVKVNSWGPASATIVYEEKPCGENAVDSAAVGSGSGGGVGGGVGGGGVGGAPPWPGCIYGCWGEVGEVEPV